MKMIEYVREVRCDVLFMKGSVICRMKDMSYGDILVWR